MAKMQSVRSLAVMMAGIGGDSFDGVRYENRELGQSAFDAMNKLPNLTALDLDESQFHDKFMAQLPKQLRYLRLGDHVMNPLTIAALQRLEDLQELRFNQGANNDAAVELLQSLRLKKLWLRGWLNGDVVDALANHVTVEDATLRLHGPRVIDLAGLAGAPRLRSLTLRYDDRFDRGALPTAATLKAFETRGITVTQHAF